MFSEDFDVLIGAEGVLRLRHAATGGLAALADADEWRTAFALLQGGELFVKDLPVNRMAPIAAVSAADVAGAGTETTKRAARPTRSAASRPHALLRRSKSLELPSAPRWEDNDTDDPNAARATEAGAVPPAGAPQRRRVPRSKSLAMGLAPKAAEDGSQDPEQDGGDNDDDAPEPAKGGYVSPTAALKGRSKSIGVANRPATIAKARAAAAAAAAAATGAVAAAVARVDGVEVAASWMLEGATVQWLEEALLASDNEATTAAHRRLLTAVDGYEPQSIVHCAHLAWGDLLLWPDVHEHAADWLYQLRVAAGMVLSDDEEEVPLRDEDDDQDGDSQGHLAGGDAGVDAHDAANDSYWRVSSVSLRLHVPRQPHTHLTMTSPGARSPGAPTPPIKDRSVSPSSKELPPPPGATPTAGPPVDGAASTTGGGGAEGSSVAIRVRPPPLSMDALGPAPIITSVASRRQSRFGLGAVPKTPLESKGLNLARRSHCIPHRFVTENSLLRLAKCKLCRHTIFDLRCSRCNFCNSFYHQKCALNEGPNCGMAHIERALEDALRHIHASSGSTDKIASGPDASQDRLAVGRSSSSASTVVAGRRMKTIGDDIFGVPLVEMMVDDQALPSIATTCMRAIEKRGLDSVGIYRVSGMKRETERLRMHFAFGRPNLLDENEWPDINVVAGVFKGWLRELPDPLLTYDLFTELTDLVDFRQEPAVDPSRLRTILLKLPRIHYRVLRAVMFHLRRVADHAAVNKMPYANLGSVFGPTLMSSRADTGVAYLGHQTALVECLIVSVDTVFARSG